MTNATPNLDTERQRRASRGVCGYDNTDFGVRICTLECKPCSRIQNCPILERKVTFAVEPISVESRQVVTNRDENKEG